MSGPGGARIDCEGLVRIYSSSETEVVALQGLDLSVEPGETVSVVGASGSGKSTLMNILAGLDQPTAGRVQVAGHDLLAMRDSERLEYRRRVVGFLWQETARNLLPYLTAHQNVMVPLTLAADRRKAKRRNRASQLLDLVGLADRATHKPHALSGGEQQRVALAVALANDPQLLLADEPTGELDEETASQVVELLLSVTNELAVTLLVVTHDSSVAAVTDRRITIRDGRVSSEQRGGRYAGLLPEIDHVVLDRAGRLQLPDEHVQRLELGRLLRVDLEDDHLRIRDADR